LLYRYFNNDARSTASSRGMPGIRIIPEGVVSECTIMEEIETEVNAVFEDIIAALTRPLTAEEKSPGQKEAEKTARIVFKGNNREVNRFFYQRGWTDGLPVIPPTEEEVAEMLTGTDLAPGHIVTTLQPRAGKATIEKIAINAVMAGALPTHMPILVAGTRALTTNPVANMMLVSTGSWAPFWVVNGPVRKDVYINDFYGAFSPGDIANAAIGRALALIIKNIGGIRKGIEDMGVFGNPSKYSMLIGENEEASPWEPLHVEQGFKKEDSTITLSFPHAYQQLSCYRTSDKGILDTAVYNLYPGRMSLLNMIFTPPNAKTLGSKGWTKKSIREYIYKNARVPRNSLTMSYVGIEDVSGTPEMVPMFPPGPRQEPIQIIVAGGMGSWVGLLSGGSPKTEKIELPANWAELVAKYKNIVPTYAKY
jgi:hypothetical protein